MTPKPSILERILSALGIAKRRRILPTWMGTAQLRELGEKFWGGAVFSARTTSAKYLTQVKGVVDEILAGEMDLPLARLTLKRTLQAIGYTPEGGFPDDPDGAKIPPAIAGQIEDIASDRRLELVLRTQEQLMQGAAQKAQGLEPDAIRQFPAWELIRAFDREEPRDWPARWVIAMENLDRFLPRDANDEVIFPRDAEGFPRMVAMKGDPVWEALGSPDIFDDAIGVDYPPFAWNSGMRWRQVPQQEVRALGVTGPEGQPLDDVLKVLPRPQASALGIDPAVLAKLKADLKLKDEAGKLTEGGDA